jgi:uncharacterized FlaG/YvyC family protein
MAIKLNQAFAGQPLRSSVAGDTPTSHRVASKSSSAPVGETEASKAAAAADIVGAVAPENVLEAMAASEVEAGTMIKAVEQANKVAESVLCATNCSIEFGVHDRSGRMTITIREEVNGHEVKREIPPKEFLRVLETLESVGPENKTVRGALVNLDA